MMLRLASRWGHIFALFLLGLVTLGLVGASLADLAHKRRMTQLLYTLNISPILPVHVPERHERLADHPLPAAKPAATDEGFGAYDPKQLTRSWIPNRP